MSARCPYLGLADRRDQVKRGAHGDHRCYAAGQPERIGNQYQAVTCLGASYRDCPRLAGQRAVPPAVPQPVPQPVPGTAPGTAVQPAPRVAPLVVPLPPTLSVPATSQSDRPFTELRAAPRARRRPLKAFDLVSLGLLLSVGATILFLAYAVYHRRAVGPGLDLALAGEQAAPRQATLVPTYTPRPSATPPPTILSPALPAEGTAGAATPVATLAAAETPPPRPAAVGPPTRLVITALGLDISVQPVGTKEVRTGGATRVVWGDVPYAGAFHNTSAYPGHAGNVVINGHRDIAGAVFRDLDRVVVGDEIVVYVGEAAYAYQVTEILIVPETYATAQQRASNRALIGPYPEERLTLVTCTPVGLATHRLVVIAHPPPPSAPDLPMAGDEP